MLRPEAFLDDRQRVQQEQAGLVALRGAVEDRGQRHPVEGRHHVILAERSGVKPHRPSAVIGGGGQVAARELKSAQVVLHGREIRVAQPTHALDHAERPPVRDRAAGEVTGELADHAEIREDRRQLERLRAESTLRSSLRLEEVALGRLEVADLAPHRGSSLESERDCRVALPRVRQDEGIHDSELGVGSGRVEVPELQVDESNLGRDLGDDPRVVDLPGKVQGRGTTVMGLLKATVVPTQSRKADQCARP